MPSRIHFTSGEKIDVAGDLTEVQDRLTSGAGAPVLFTEDRGRNPDQVLVNPQLVTHVETAPGRGGASF